MRGKKTRRQTRRVPKRRAGKDIKGIFFTNPIVAAQTGATIGTLLATIYAEQPDILKKLEPVIDTFGRTREREDVIAYIELVAGPKSRRPPAVRAALAELIRSLRAEIHRDEGKSRYREALNREIAPLQEMLGIQEWTRNDKKEKS